MKKYMLLLIFVLVLCGCNYQAKEQPIYDSHRVERYVDEEAGVVCWVYTAPLRGGIYCIPIEETKLKSD